MRAVQREPDPDGRLDGGLVGDRQAAGQAQADRADLGVGLGAEVGRAAAEHLGARAQLDVRLQADHRLVPGNDVVEVQQGHGAHRCSSSDSGVTDLPPSLVADVASRTPTRSRDSARYGEAAGRHTAGVVRFQELGKQACEERSAPWD